MNWPAHNVFIWMAADLLNRGAQHRAIEALAAWRNRPAPS